MGISVSTSGPLFDGQAEAIFNDARQAGLARLSEKGASLARQAFDGAIRANQGRFIGSVTVFQSSTTVSDAGYTMAIDVPQKTEVVSTTTASYGPWLDGEGSRNASTRFKGYHGFREAAGELNAVAGTEAEAALRPFIERVNA